MRLLAPLLALLVACAYSVAEAAPRSGDPEVRRLERMGRDAYSKKRWDDAIAAFESACELDPQPKYLFNVARAHERKEDLTEAISYLLRFLGEAESDKDREDAEARVTVLRKRRRTSMGEVRLTSKPAGATVELTGPSGQQRTVRTPFEGWLELDVGNEGLTRLSIRFEKATEGRAQGSSGGSPLQ